LQDEGDPNVVIALAGNKADLDARRKVDFEEARAYAEENGILHLETSAKNANNVKALLCGNCNEITKESSPTGTRGVSRSLPPQQDSRSCC
jgi:Ras-related protein Rab-5C